MSKRFTKYFKSSLNEGSQPIEPASELDDSAAFAGSFEDEAVADDVNGEVEAAGIDPSQHAEILRKADKYAENIDKLILPVLRKIHNDIVTGTFSTVAPDIKGISGITEDLASLAESLRGRVRDAIASINKQEQ